jgi:hypothetical protein
MHTGREEAMTSTGLEDQLRAEIARVPAQVPPGLARTAYRRYRRRRATIRAITATGTAAVVAGAAIGIGIGHTGSAGTAGPGQATNAETAAYVVDRITRAVDAIPKDAITFERTTYQPASGQFTPEDDWTANGLYRSVTFNSAGKPATELGFTGTRTSSTMVQVDYQHKTWSRSVYTFPRRRPAPLPSASSSCANAGFIATSKGTSRTGSTSTSWAYTSILMVSGTPSAMVQAIRTAQSCGKLKVAGSEEIGGIKTIKLVESAGGYTLTVWVSKSSYLPVRYDIQTAGTPTEQTDIQYLPPTRANVAQLIVHIPAGFRQVPPEQS